MTQPDAILKLAEQAVGNDPLHQRDFLACLCARLMDGVSSGYVRAQPVAPPRPGRRPPPTLE